MDSGIDTKTPIGAELARRQSNADPGPTSTRSALREFLDNSIDHEKAPWPIPRELVLYGMIGAVITVAVAIAGLAISHPSGLRDSQFLLVFKDWTAAVATALHSIAWPLLGLGVLMLVAGIGMWGERPRSSGWRYAIVGETICGGGAALFSFVFVIFFIINALIWLALIAIVATVIGVVIAALLSGT